jgi:hypothetical protein
MKRSKWKDRLYAASQKREGYTMIVVLCLMALFMALALSLLLASSLSMSRANQTYSQEQCRISAISFSKALEEYLGSDTNQLTVSIRQEIEHQRWPYYDEEDTSGAHNEMNAMKYFSADNTFKPQVEEQAGTIKVKMYWETNDEEAVNDPDNPDYGDSELVVVVTCSLKKQEYNVTTRYRATVENENPDADPPGEKKVWDGTWNRIGRDGS